MKTAKLTDYTRGWFCGNFEPSILKNAAFEVGFHSYKAGETCEPHMHKVATEINLVVSGRMIANGIELSKGAIFVFEPQEYCHVQYLEDTELVIVKSPSIIGDKYNGK